MVESYDYRGESFCGKLTHLPFRCFAMAPTVSAVAKEPQLSFLIFGGPLLDWSGQTVLFSHWSKVSDVTVVRIHPTRRCQSWSTFEM